MAGAILARISILKDRLVSSVRAAEGTLLGHLAVFLVVVFFFLNHQFVDVFWPVFHVVWLFCLMLFDVFLRLAVSWPLNFRCFRIPECFSNAATLTLLTLRVMASVFEVTKMSLLPGT